MNGRAWLNSHRLIVLGLPVSLTADKPYLASEETDPTKRKQAQLPAFPNSKENPNNRFPAVAVDCECYHPGGKIIKGTSWDGSNAIEPRGDATTFLLVPNKTENNWHLHNVFGDQAPILRNNEAA